MNTTLTTPAGWGRGILYLTALQVIGVAVLVGLVFVYLTSQVTSSRTQNQFRTRLGELLETVESTARIACFTKDQTLATEVANGLMKNSEVLGVVLRSGSEVLSTNFKPSASPSMLKRAKVGRLLTPITSPFDPGLIVDIGLWTLEAGCQQLAAWQAQGKDYYLSLNISGRQIPDGLPPARLIETVHRYGLDPASLALEITEGVFMGDVSQAQSWLSTVREHGFRIYLDDFGTGYSSLSYLKRFPVDTLKVDKSFVRDMSEDNSDRTLVEAIVAMAGSLGLSVVAEGVETAEQLALLGKIGCRYIQGYHFSRPVPAGEFDAVAERIAEMLA